MKKDQENITPYNQIRQLLDLANKSDNGTRTQPNSRNEHGNFLCISGQFGPRWIIPADPSIGLPILIEWRPYNLFSKLKWQVLLLAYRLSFVNRLPGVKVLVSDINTDAVAIPVIYIGTPGPQQKTVVSWVSARSRRLKSVMKIALGSKAKESISQENKILIRLSKMNLAFTTPTPLKIAENGKWATQTFIQGCLSGKKLTEAHVHWLLQLPKSGEKTTIDQQQRCLKKKIESCKEIDANLKRRLINVASKITGGPIPLVLIHGDFLPWNLKLQRNGHLTAIDWEDASFKGFPLWDLCHFFFMQGHLFNTASPVKRIKKCSLVYDYLNGMGLSEKTMAPLISLYILNMILEETRQISPSYRQYLIDQIKILR